jgi:LysR family transcriptional activator of nhaA
MVNLEQPHTFYTLVTNGSLAKASERPFITAPAIFMEVRSLKRYISYKLIERMGREIKLIDLGDIVYGYCKRIFSSVEEMKTFIHGEES